jgi:hypothetical protein
MQPVVDFALYKVRRDQSRLPAHMQSDLVSFARIGEFRDSPDLWAERHSPLSDRLKPGFNCSASESDVERDLRPTNLPRRDGVSGAT